MGVGYELVNNTKREIISFIHIPASEKRELAGNPVSAAITTWYMLENAGDEIAFVSDTYGDWPFSTGENSDLSTFLDVTARTVDALISAGILRDDGIEWADQDEPNTVFTRALVNVWTKKRGRESFY